MVEGIIVFGIVVIMWLLKLVGEKSIGSYLLPPSIFLLIVSIVIRSRAATITHTKKQSAFLNMAEMFVESSIALTLVAIYFWVQFLIN